MTVMMSLKNTTTSYCTCMMQRNGKIDSTECSTGYFEILRVSHLLESVGGHFDSLTVYMTKILSKTEIQAQTQDEKLTGAPGLHIVPHMSRLIL
eukprot:SAG11_NODE_1222_length_5484_cov_7.843268_8_plen_93_part_01